MKHLSRAPDWSRNSFGSGNREESGEGEEGEGVSWKYSPSRQRQWILTYCHNSQISPTEMLRVLSIRITTRQSLWVPGSVAWCQEVWRSVRLVSTVKTLHTYWNIMDQLDSLISGLIPIWRDLFLIWQTRQLFLPDNTDLFSNCILHNLSVNSSSNWFLTVGIFLLPDFSYFIPF